MVELEARSMHLINQNDAEVLALVSAFDGSYSAIFLSAEKSSLATRTK